MEEFNLLPKKKQKNVLQSRIKKIFLGFFSMGVIVILVLAGLAYFFNQKIVELNQELASIKQQQQNVTEIEYSVFQIKKSALDKLKKDQIFWSEVFSIIDKNTLASVNFLNFSSNLSTNTILMTGHADSYNAAADQVELFSTVENFREVDASNYTNKESGGVDFKISLIYIK